LVKDGILFVTIPLLIGIVLLIFNLWGVAILFFILAAFMAYFFRDPNRVIPNEIGIVLSPADGKVTKVERIDPTDSNSPTLVSIFLSPLDVHINRSPIAGIITDVAYSKGRFMMATKEQASIVNEQNALTIQGEHVTLVCKQIAGILARRIVCWKRAGDRVELGERIGLIKFSSRTDLLLPAEVEVEVKEGMRVRGGITIIGRIR
jgi:phosphatidylserine decarboxylase